MAIKYVRKHRGEDAKGTHGRFDQHAEENLAALRRRLVVIYIGLIAFGIMLFVTHATGLLQRASWQGPQAGEGVIVEKRITELDGVPESYILVVGVTVSGPEGDVQLLDEVPTDEQSWRLVEEGQRVEVMFRVARDKTVVRIDAIAATRNDSE